MVVKWLFGIFVILCIFLVPNVNGQFVSEVGTTHGEGLYYLNSTGFVALPINFSEGEQESADNTWGVGVCSSVVLPDPYCLFCDQRSGREKCNSVVIIPGLSEGFYSMVIAGYGGNTDRRNITFEVYTTSLYDKTNYTAECDIGAGSYDCNWTNFDYDGVGIPLYVNSTGNATFRIIGDGNNDQDAGDLKVLTFYNFTNWRSGEASVSISSPTNTTYYNNLTEFLSFSVILNTTAFTFNYSLNGGTNISAKNFSLINVGSGPNYLVVYGYNETNYFSSDVNFKTDFICDSVHNGEVVCGGLGFNYLLECEKYGFNTYQWNVSNMTLCPYGCLNGQCIAPEKTCKDRCVANSTICDNRYVVTCTLKNDGCYDWSSSNTTYCELGCYAGKCVLGYDRCELGESRCNAKYIEWCDDDNNDGYNEYSKINRTYCQFDCIEEFNSTTGLNNVTCNVHSFDDIYTIRQYIQTYERGANYIFDSPGMKLGFILFMATITSLLLGILTRNFAVGFITLVVVGGLGLVWWIPQFMYLFILFIILGGVFFLKGGSSE